jgi:hypothetical protein
MRQEVIKALTPKKGSLVPATSFQAITFYDAKQERQVIVLYALGSDGIVREYNGQAWRQYPIEKE